MGSKRVRHTCATEHALISKAQCLQAQEAKHQSVCVCCMCVCVCVCWEVVYRVCLKQTRQWAFDCVGVGVTPCRPRAPSPGWSAVTVSLQAMHRAHLFLCCWLHSTTPSVISSCGLAGWLHRGQAPATSSCCYCVIYAHSKQWSLQKAHHAPALLRELAESPPALPAHTQGTLSYSSLKNISKWTRRQLRCLPTSNVGCF